MSRPQSRSRRQAAFLEEAKRMYEQLEDWYDKHPEASFGKIEVEVGIFFVLSYEDTARQIKVDVNRRQFGSHPL
jgi:hypothetical protein